MGFIRQHFGRLAIEERSESFVVHPGYGYDETGNEPTNLVQVNGGLEVREAFARWWREHGHPEFTYDSLDDLIAALVDLRESRTGETTEALRGMVAEVLAAATMAKPCMFLKGFAADPNWGINDPLAPADLDPALVDQVVTRLKESR